MKFAELKLLLYLFKAYTKSARKIQVKIRDSEPLSTSFFRLQNVNAKFLFILMYPSRFHGINCILRTRALL